MGGPFRPSRFPKRLKRSKRTEEKINEPTNPLDPLALIELSLLPGSRKSPISAPHSAMTTVPTAAISSVTATAATIPAVPATTRNRPLDRIPVQSPRIIRGKCPALPLTRSGKIHSAPTYAPLHIRSAALPSNSPSQRAPILRQRKRLRHSSIRRLKRDRPGPRDISSLRVRRRCLRRILSARDASRRENQSSHQNRKPK